MSEHREALPPPMSESDPVLRQALHTFMAQFMERTYHTTVLYDFGGQLADALLAAAGPVGKLQAELADAQRQIASLQSALDAWEPPATERIRREAIGAWVLAHIRWHEFRPWRPWAPEPYPGACGWCGHPEQLHPWATLVGGPSRIAGYDHGLNAVLAAGESAVTGEAT